MSRLRGEVVILGKTRMGPHVCVGGFDLTNLRAVRLLGSGGENPQPCTPYELHDLWLLEYEPQRNIRVPHSEDVRVKSGKRIAAGTRALSQALPHLELVGSLDDAFENQLYWTAHGSGYINVDGGVPDYSICFWRTPNDIRTHVDGHAVYYIASERPARRLKYVGVAAHAPFIPRSSLLRLSLARWWSPEDADVEERCYLQLSGWFNDRD